MFAQAVRDPHDNAEAVYLDTLGVSFMGYRVAGLAIPDSAYLKFEISFNFISA